MADTAQHGLEVVRIDAENWRAALEVQVTAEQLPFVAGYQPVALVILAKCYLRPGGLEWEPLAISQGAVLVAVAALAHASTTTELLHLAVAAKRQRQGVGSASVSLLIEHVRRTRPEVKQLRLTVHADNGPAQRLYERHGFAPNGEVRDGEPVWTLDLSRE